MKQDKEFETKKYDESVLEQVLDIRRKKAAENNTVDGNDAVDSDRSDSMLVKKNFAEKDDSEKSYSEMNDLEKDDSEMNAAEENETVEEAYISEERKAEKNIGKAEEKGTEKDPGGSAEKEAEKDPGGSAEKEAEKDTDKSEGKETEKDPSGSDKKEHSEISEKAEEKSQDKTTGVSRAYGKKGPRKRKKHRKKHYLLKISIGLAIIIGILFYLNSTKFDINQINVEGNSKFSAETIIKTSGLELSKNIFTMSAHKGKKALLKNPYFEEVDIIRDMPDKVTIKVKERLPFVTIKKNKKWILLDKNDIALEEKESPGRVTPVNGMFIKKYELGKKAEITGNESYNDVKRILNKSVKQKIHFKRVDVYKNYILLYLKKKLYCKGTIESIEEALDSGNMRKVMIFCWKAKYNKGVVNIAGNGYVAVKAK